MDDQPGRSQRDAIETLLTDYYELNGSIIEELHEEPSPLEFMRHVARNTPFVVRGAAKDWKAYQEWDSKFLKDYLGDQPVNVAVTPHGNADAPTPLEDGTLTLSKPHEEDQPFCSFLDTIISQTKADQGPSSSPPSSPAPSSSKEDVLYAQTQNDNLRNEYSSLFSLSHLPPSIPFARIALGQEGPEALNLWIGNARAVTAMHKDNYENIYVQLRGRKHFVLLPPLCQPCVNEKPLKPSTYRRKGKCDVDGHENLVLELDGCESTVDNSCSNNGNMDVPFATWDPDVPEVNTTPYSHLAEPMRVTLEPGDILYLPAMWYHKVSQFCTPADEGFVLAVNYWYDMDFSGPLFPMSSFVRNVSLQQEKSSPRA